MFRSIQSSFNTTSESQSNECRFSALHAPLDQIMQYHSGIKPFLR